MTHIALLRGVNVGGKNALPMREVAAIFAEAGCQHVRTYIQSGNVLFDATSEVARSLATTIPERMKAEFGLKVPTMVRTRRQLASVARANPYLGRRVDVRELFVMFLSSSPPSAGVERLDPKRSLPDSFIVSGREIYLRCPNGIGRSKLTNAYFDTALSTVSTTRNWKTVLALLELSER